MGELKQKLMDVDSMLSCADASLRGDPPNIQSANEWITEARELLWKMIEGHDEAELN